MVERAAGIIAEHGVDAVGFRSIAREGYETLAVALEQASSEHSTDEEKIRAAGAAYVDFARKHPGHFVVMFGRDCMPLDGSPMPEPFLVASERAFTALLRTIGATQFTPEALLAWSTVHGLASLWTQGTLVERMGSIAALESMVNQTLRLLATSLATRLTSGSRHGSAHAGTRR